jgi:hypothetical protein
MEDEINGPMKYSAPRMIAARPTQTAGSYIGGLVALFMPILYTCSTSARIGRSRGLELSYGRSRKNRC